MQLSIVIRVWTSGLQLLPLALLRSRLLVRSRFIVRGKGQVFFEDGIVCRERVASLLGLGSYAQRASCLRRLDSKMTCTISAIDCE